ncbi:FAD linked oxidase [Grosmannia clavigera kw1407]|uniref:FAD linked oxidase n=1 Tax=Grosmannia clavigera (strain kw1407 / UAMH 11150) TaxID=655863 RepID=F0XBK0_GROCL|nr:FAD linked oxidase [Grosmannia clavigera kw1407]EFX04920.1 FAD linked oxidase [Grosmannia clavigera kw1407]
MSVNTAAVLTTLEAFDKAGLSDLVTASDTKLYKARIESFWSLTAQKKPHSIVHPKTTEDVVKIVKALAAEPHCLFAVRAGGHSTWGASNTDGGILIDLGLHMHGATVHNDKGIVSLLPGTKWSEAYQDIAAENISIAGGRTASVGVSGLLTGGGIWWYIPRVGFGCDQIVNAEIVLSDGRVVSANRDENSDLWRALKGASAGNFGIVTRFDAKTIGWEGLWGGMLLSEPTEANMRRHIQSMKNFTNGSESRPNSSYIVLWNYEPTTFKDIIITSFAANTKGEENPPELEELLAIPATVKDFKHTTLADFAKTMEQPESYYNFWFTTTFLNDDRIMAKAVEAHMSAVAKNKKVSKTGKAEMLSMLLSVNVSEEEICDYGYEVAKEYLKEVDDYAKSVDGYIPWTYFNYADKAQNPMAKLLDPENLKAVAAKYDPEGIFQTRTPGFKVSQS